MSDSAYARWLAETIGLRDAAEAALSELAGRLERSPQQLDDHGGEALLNLRRQLRLPERDADGQIPDVETWMRGLNFALYSVRSAVERFIPSADAALADAAPPAVVRVADFNGAVQIITRDRDDPPVWRVMGDVRGLRPDHPARTLASADDLTATGGQLVLGAPCKNDWGRRYPAKWYSAESVAALTREFAETKRKEQASEAEQLRRAAEDAKRANEDAVRRDLPRRIAQLEAELARR